MLVVATQGVVERCSPKAKVTRPNRVGCVISRPSSRMVEPMASTSCRPGCPAAAIKGTDVKIIAEDAGKWQSIDHLSSAQDSEALREAMAEAAAALDLSYFAYLSISHQPGADPRLISTHPSTWTKYYLQCRYDRFDPVSSGNRSSWTI
jgi:Autoinducer binding domain